MMISDGETKVSDPHRKASHAFPVLKNNASPGPSSDCFKPLFDNSGINGSISPAEGIGVPRSGRDGNSEDCIRQKGFDRGFDAGRQDACSLVQKQTAPQIKSFADALSLWNAIMMRVEEKSNLQILKMAVAIAEKILGSPPQCGTGKLESLRDELTARMRKAYRLEFKLNPSDMDALTGLMTCEKVHLEQWDYIAATGDTDVQRGALLGESGTQGLLADAGILRSLDALLSEGLTQVSTK
jgi:hypothetical protein